MPIYEYECGNCGRFTALRKLAEYERPAPCPACGRAASRTLTHPAWCGTSARQRGYDAAAPSLRPGSVTPRAHGMSCNCCGADVLGRAMNDAAAASPPEGPA
ncbi:FmdB family zinc ribbon protein [Bordetella sp. 2513F-2]